MKKYNDQHKKHRRRVKRCLLLLGLISPALAFASEDSTSTGFLTFLSKIAGYLDSSGAHWMAIIAVAWAGFMIAFGDLQQGGSKLLKVGVGMSIAFGAATLISTFFTTTGAVIA